MKWKKVHWEYWVFALQGQGWVTDAFRFRFWNFSCWSGFQVPMPYLSSGIQGPCSDAVWSQVLSPVYLHLFQVCVLLYSTTLSAVARCLFVYSPIYLLIWLLFIYLFTYLFITFITYTCIHIWFVSSILVFPTVLRCNYYFIICIPVLAVKMS